MIIRTMLMGGVVQVLRGVWAQRNSWSRCFRSRWRVVPARVLSILQAIADDVTFPTLITKSDDVVNLN